MASPLTDDRTFPAIHARVISFYRRVAGVLILSIPSLPTTRPIERRRARRALVKAIRGADHGLIPSGMAC
jgi:hypothetical protein